MLAEQTVTNQNRGWEAQSVHRKREGNQSSQNYNERTTVQGMAFKAALKTRVSKLRKASQPRLVMKTNVDFF